MPCNVLFAGILPASGILPWARGRPGRGAEAVAGATRSDPARSAARGPRHRGGRRNDARGWDIDGLILVWGRAIYCVPATSPVLPEGVTSPSSAAIAGTNLGIGTNVDANIGRTAPVHPSSFRRFERGIASCSDRQTLACGSAVACDMSIARSGIVPALARLGGGPLPHSARRGPPLPVVGPVTEEGASMPRP